MGASVNLDIEYAVDCELVREYLMAIFTALRYSLDMWEFLRSSLKSFRYRISSLMSEKSPFCSALYCIVSMFVSVTGISKVLSESGGD